MKSSTLSVGLYCHKKTQKKVKITRTSVHAAGRSEGRSKGHKGSHFFTSPHKDKSFAHLYLRWAPGIGQKPSLGHVAVYFAPFQGFTVFIEKMTADQGSPWKEGDSFVKTGLSCFSGHVLIIPEGVLASQP